ncbi:MAG: HAD-IIB family hydrolase, partial [Pseudomonadota bacterium]
IYARREDALSDTISIARIDGATPHYRSKEKLHTEHAELRASLFRFIEGLDQKPDVIHAHYADAGYLAAEVKKAFAIPYIFTGHSLGRVKQATLTDDEQIDPDLEARIATEERAIRDADLIITSSRNEAELQYGLYAAAKPERIRVIPPGVDVDAISDAKQTLFPNDLLQSINRFLTEPGKPPILALARPVRRKNLSGLLKAYGEDKSLQRRANLVVFAGTRTDLEVEETENRQVLSELLYLVDRYDLYGRVAIPKQHTVQDVPYIYRYATELGGVFVNPAFNEPFGLTLIEAAAAGLPVVATMNGGPTDIVATCNNGRLINPTQPTELVEAIVDLLDRPETWETFSQNGVASIARYSWSAHVADYLRAIKAIRAAATPPTATSGRKRDRASSTRSMQPARSERATARQSLLVSDIDNTLTGSQSGLADFAAWQAEQNDTVFAIATGRTLHDALRVLRDNNAPAPAVLVTSVGSEIYYAENGLDKLVADARWADHCQRNWDRARVADLVASLADVSRQPDIEQRNWKLSYFGSETVAQAIRHALRVHRIAATVIFSHGNYIDVLPPQVSKGHALEHVAQRLRIAMPSTIAAGDSGNDLEMLKRAARSVIVGNCTNELDALRGSAHAYFAKAHFADGIIEGLKSFGLYDRCRNLSASAHSFVTAQPISRMSSPD